MLSCSYRCGLPSYIQQEAAKGGNSYWYKLAGSLYEYLDWGNY